MAAGTQASRRPSQIAIGDHGVVKPERCQVEAGFPLVDTPEPTQVIDHLGCNVDRVRAPLSLIRCSTSLAAPSSFKNASNS